MAPTFHPTMYTPDHIAMAALMDQYDIKPTATYTIATTPPSGVTAPPDPNIPSPPSQTPAIHTGLQQHTNPNYLKPNSTQCQE